MTKQQKVLRISLYDVIICSLKTRFTKSYAFVTTGIIKYSMSVKHTSVWLHREVWVSLTDAVDQFGTVPIHCVISICSCHLGDRCT